MFWDYLIANVLLSEPVKKKQLLSKVGQYLTDLRSYDKNFVAYFFGPLCVFTEIIYYNIIIILLSLLHHFECAAHIALSLHVD